MNDKQWSQDIFTALSLRLLLAMRALQGALL